MKEVKSVKAPPEEWGFMFLLLRTEYLHKLLAVSLQGRFISFYNGEPKV